MRKGISLSLAVIIGVGLLLIPTASQANHRVSNGTAADAIAIAREHAAMARAEAAASRFGSSGFANELAAINRAVAELVRDARAGRFNDIQGDLAQVFAFVDRLIAEARGLFQPSP